MIHALSMSIIWDAKEEEIVSSCGASWGIWDHDGHAYCSLSRTVFWTGVPEANQRRSMAVGVAAATELESGARPRLEHLVRVVVAYAARRAQVSSIELQEIGPATTPTTGSSHSSSRLHGRELAHYTMTVEILRESKVTQGLPLHRWCLRACNAGSNNAGRKSAHQQYGPLGMAKSRHQVTQRDQMAQKIRQAFDCLCLDRPPTRHKANRTKAATGLPDAIDM